jgi:hypothetical protein
MWSAVCSQPRMGGRHRGAKMTRGGGQADQQSLYTGAVSFRTTGSAGARETSRL